MLLGELKLTDVTDRIRVVTTHAGGEESSAPYGDREDLPVFTEFPQKHWRQIVVHGAVC
ncbi:MAG: hypothetical protein ACYCZY_06040 [Lacisediminihabitans sp.]